MSGGASPEFEAKLEAIAKRLHAEGAIIERDPNAASKPFAPYAELDRDADQNSDQPPEVDIWDDRKRLPPPDAAAHRVIAFVSWFGDGEIMSGGYSDDPPLYSRDLAVLASHALGTWQS